MRIRLAIAILLLSTARAPAHRLDEYLQATLISIANDRLQVEMTLTPGVAVFPIVAADIDTDHDGVISETEQRAYAARMLRDLSVTIDGRPLTPRLLSLQFPTIGEMKEGLGGIRIEFQAGLPSGGRSRRFVLENRHQTRFGAYLVNCLLRSHGPTCPILASPGWAAFFRTVRGRQGTASVALPSCFDFRCFPNSAHQSAPNEQHRQGSV